MIALAIAAPGWSRGSPGAALAAHGAPQAADHVRAGLDGAAAPTVPGADRRSGRRRRRRRLAAGAGSSGLVGLALIWRSASRCRATGEQIRWRVVAWGLGLQVLFAIFVLRIPAGQAALPEARRHRHRHPRLLATSGSQFVFGELGKPNSSLGVIFAFQILPAIIFVSALFAIMYYLGIMQLIVRAFAVVMSRGDGRERRREPQRRGLDLHGTDRGAADHPAVPAADDPLGADDGDDVGDGPHLRLDHGGVHRVRRSRRGTCSPPSS